MAPQWQFNPPPNWPTPVSTPGPEWRPDPHWGPPPVGWELWQQRRHRGVLLRNWVAGLVAGMLVLTALVVVQMGALHPARGPVGPVGSVAPVGPVGSPVVRVVPVAPAVRVEQAALLSHPGLP